MRKLFAEVFPQITNVYNWATYSLSGKQKYNIDQAEIGNKKKFRLDKEIKDRSELLEFNFETSQQLKFPGNWNSQSVKLLYYEGKIWYRISFPLIKKTSVNFFILARQTIKPKCSVHPLADDSNLQLVPF